MNNKKTSFIKAGIFAVIGLLFVLIPGLVSKYFMIILGSTIIAYGILTLLSAIKTNSSSQTKVAIIIALCGGFVILLSDFILSVVGVFIALFCLFSGISNLNLSLKRKEMELSYIVYMIKGGISIILGVVFLVLPKSAIDTQIILLGIYLLFSSINQIYKGMTAQEKEYDFINFYFHKDKNDTDNKVKDDSIIDVESSVIDNDKDVNQ